MGRSITQKVLDEDHPSLESPDESFLKADARIGEIPGDFSGGDDDTDVLPSLDEGGGDGDSFPKYSLDDFSASEPSVPGTSGDASGRESASTGAWKINGGFGFLQGGR
jgi:hypothetical protein